MYVYVLVASNENANVDFISGIFSSRQKATLEIKKRKDGYEYSIMKFLVK